MKKAIFLLLFTFTISLSAQSIRVYNLNVAPENAASVGDLFKEYHENNIKLVKKLAPKLYEQINGKV